MTPAEPQAPDVHPDLDTLADLHEGLLPPTPAATVSAHLDGCESCSADFEALGQLPGQLAAAAETGAMPADLVSRLDDALAVEGREATVNVVPLTSARSSRPARDNRVLQAAAAAVLLLAATAVGVSALQDRSPDTAADSASAGKDARELSAGSVRVLSSGADYTAESVAAAVPRLLNGDGPEVQLQPEPEPAAADSSGATSAQRLSAGAALSGCVIALADDANTTAIEMPAPLVVDIAMFSGQAATVIVLPAPDETDRLDVYVVGPGCAPADAKVLHFARVARP